MGDTALYKEILDEARAMAAEADLRVRTTPLRTVARASQITIYGARHTGTYRNGETTKLRLTSTDPEAELQIVGLTGNSVETFEIKSSLGQGAFLGLQAIREGIHLMIEELA